MKTCATCKHRSEDHIDTYRYDDNGNELPTTYYACGRVLHGNRYDGNDYKAGEKALAIDGSGYQAKLVVEADFGCVLHEPRGIEAKVNEQRTAR